MERGHVHPEHGAHPRSRGEHSITDGSTTTSLGSSPLARGTHALRLSLEHQRGLIPARAGNTLQR